MERERIGPLPSIPYFIDGDTRPVNITLLAYLKGWVKETLPGNIEEYYQTYFKCISAAIVVLSSPYKAQPPLSITLLYFNAPQV